MLGKKRLGYKAYLIGSFFKNLWTFGWLDHFLDNSAHCVEKPKSSEGVLGNAKYLHKTSNSFFSKCTRFGGPGTQVWNVKWWSIKSLPEINECTILPGGDRIVQRIWGNAKMRFWFLPTQGPILIFQCCQRNHKGLLSDERFWPNQRWGPSRPPLSCQPHDNHHPLMFRTMKCKRFLQILLLMDQPKNLIRKFTWSLEIIIWTMCIRKINRSTCASWNKSFTFLTYFSNHWSDIKYKPERCQRDRKSRFRRWTNSASRRSMPIKLQRHRFQGSTGSRDRILTKWTIVEVCGCACL